MKIKALLIAGLLWGGLATAQKTERVWAPYDTVVKVNRGTGEAPPAEKKKFDKDKLVFGGNLGATFGDRTFVNFSPQVGYRFNQYVTAGTGINFVFASYKYYTNQGNDWFKENYTNAGVNVFARVFPVNFLFISVQPEANYNWGKIKYYDSYSTAPDFKQPGKIVPSLIVGAGAILSSGGRGGVTASVQYDVIQNERSPYGTKPYLSIGFIF